MGLTATQLAARSEGIGASEIGAIMGLDPFKNAWAVWAEKTGKLTPQPETDAMKWGNVLEPVIIDMARQEMNRRIVRATGTYKHKNGIMFANLDAQIVEEGKQAARGCEVVECKSSRINAGWGEPGTEEVPDRVALQATAQMMCSDARMAYVARLSFEKWGPQFGIYPITYNAELAEQIEQACVEFWEKHVQADIPPENIEIALDDAKRLIRRPGATVAVPPSLVVAYDKAREQAKEAEEAKDAAQAALLAALNGAEIGACDGFVITHKMINALRLDQKALKEAHPEIVERFTKVSPYARLDVRAPKKQ